MKTIYITQNTNEIALLEKTIAALESGMFTTLTIGKGSFLNAYKIDDPDYPLLFKDPLNEGELTEEEIEEAKCVITWSILSNQYEELNYLLEPYIGYQEDYSTLYQKQLLEEPPFEPDPDLKYPFLNESRKYLKKINALEILSFRINKLNLEPISFSDMSINNIKFTEEGEAKLIDLGGLFPSNKSKYFEPFNEVYDGLK